MNSKKEKFWTEESPKKVKRLMREREQKIMNNISKKFSALKKIKK